MTVIAHTTDLSGDDTAAFVHASALATASSARLITVHGNAPDSTAAQLPDAGELARRWGRTIEHERRCHECCDDVSDTVLDALRDLKPQLVVVGTHGGRGLAALIRGSVGETIARNLDVPTLVVPNRVRGFADAATGAIDLRRILIPAGDVAEAERGIAAARAFLELTGVTSELEIVHAGAEQIALARLGVLVTRVPGNLEDAILSVAREHDACLIVMPTRGHDGMGDVLLGSHTERVMRAAQCPVLSVPM